MPRRRPLQPPLTQNPVAARPSINRSPLAAAVSALSLPALVSPASTLAADQVIEEVVVTATRRSVGIQDVPININAVTGEQISEQGVRDLAELSTWVPGVHMVDQGARGADRIVVRGLNADPLSSAEALDNSSGGTVATYVGEIPLYVDLKLNDMERVEVLLGPQGTLYGAGTMGGAIRYIPTRPQMHETSFQLRGDVFDYSEADNPGLEAGITANFDLGERAAFRINVDYLADPGFVDYTQLVRTVGVSNPDPDPADPEDVAANLHAKEDVNDEDALSGRIALRVRPADSVDAILTYYFQNVQAGGRTINHRDGFGTGDYESALRVEEPNERENRLLAFELTADLGFAELTSATGYADYEEDGSRDQTDLLISLEYSYEAFPSFTAFTREDVEEETLTQEVRLVSRNDGPFDWIAGGFYSTFELDLQSKEFTPGYDLFAVNNFGGVGPRPDALEYFSVDLQELTETALFGELTYRPTDRWQVTIGGRWYDYELDADSAVDFPLFNTVFDGAAPDAVTLDFERGGQDDDGTLFKFNASYHVTDDMMVYFTRSEGYRIGNSNGVAPCPDPLPDNQIACALPSEAAYFPDETTNYEIGVRSSWLDNRLTLNGAAYFIDWDDPQVAGATENALIAITTNGDGAESQGVELTFNWLISDNLAVRGSYAYNEMELSDTTERLVPTLVPPGFQGTISYIDGVDGDRLPGSPEHQGSLFVAYNRALRDGLELSASYGVWAIGDVLTRTGEKGGGEALPGYAVHNLSVSVASDAWRVTLYADNLTDRYVETGVRDTQLFAQQVTDINGDPVTARRYFKNVLPPRAVGLRFSWDLLPD